MWSLMLIGTGYIQVLYLGRAPCTKETLPDFHEKCRVTRHSRVFRGLTGSQRTPGFWGVTCLLLKVYKTFHTYLLALLCFSLKVYKTFLKSLACLLYLALL